MNRLAFEIVASVVVFAVVLDLVSTPDAHVLVPVLVHLVSPVVLVLDEIAVVLDPFVIAVLVIATRTVVVIVAFLDDHVATSRTSTNTDERLQESFFRGTYCIARPGQFG